MDLKSFDDVLASMKRNPKRKFHLLLGNGFSMAYDRNIFSYNALHDFIEKLNDPDLSKIFGVIETRNFELIMQYLDQFSALTDAFGGHASLKRRIDASSKKLKTSLLDAVKELHPEHVFTLPEDKSKACSLFLKRFSSTGGSIYSTNYDLLLYWILIRNSIEPHIDGCGREHGDSEEEFMDPDGHELSDLTWGKYRAKQNVHYLHGALQFFDDGVSILKEAYTSGSFLLEKISARMDKGQYPIFVTAGDGRQKLRHIMHNRYLTHCYECLSAANGSLVTFGFNFGKYDEHLIAAINKAAKFGKKNTPEALRSIYIGVYSPEDRWHIESISRKFKCKVHIYDAKTAAVWG